MKIVALQHKTTTQNYSNFASVSEMIPMHFFMHIIKYKDMTNKTDNITYVTRPKGKPDVTTKGKLNEWSNGYKEFVPQGQKPSNRTMLRQLGNSSFYRTEGTKESSYSLHLNVDGKSADPVGEMYDQFMHLTENERKVQPKLDALTQGRMLYDNGDSVKVWLDRELHKVSVLTTLDCTRNIERDLLQAQAQVSVTLGRYREEILNH
jgi:hypothetical protein